MGNDKYIGDLSAFTDIHGNRENNIASKVGILKNMITSLDPSFFKYGDVYVMKFRTHDNYKIICGICEDIIKNDFDLISQVHILAYDDLGYNHKFAVTAHDIECGDVIILDRINKERYKE